ncbi:MAG: restriction endonuclease subunit S [Candidatus Saccharimonadales bacterium]
MNNQAIKLKRVTNFISRGISPDYSEADEGIKFINQACIYWDGIKSKAIKYARKESGALTSKGVIKQGDILINSTGTGTLGRASLFDLGEKEYVADSHVTIVRPDQQKVLSAYLYYLIRSSCFQDHLFTTCVSGSTNQIELSRERLGESIINIPDIVTQESIIKYLNRKIKKIDGIIVMKNHLLELAEEKRQNLISRAVTKGLGSNELKSSNVEWLDKISTNWKVLPIKAFTKKKKKKIGYVNEQLLSVYRDYGVIVKSSRNDNYNKPSDDLSNYQLVEKNDLVLNKMKTWQGSLAVSSYQGLVSPAYIVCTLNESMVIPRFIHYALRAKHNIEFYRSISYGVRPAQWDMHYQDFRELPIALPERKEQKEIVDYLDSYNDLVDKTKNKLKQSIDYLEEYKTSLISNAVTGKVKV